MSYKRGPIKVALAFPLILCVMLVSASIHRRVSLVCPACDDSTAYLTQQVFAAIGLALSLLMLTHTVVDRVLDKLNKK